MGYYILLFNICNIQFKNTSYPSLSRLKKKTNASKFNSNFHQLNLLQAEDGSEFESWIKYKKMENDISRNPK